MSMGGMHPEDIKAALRKKGSGQTDVARRLGVSQTTVFLVIHGKAKSRRVAKKISQVVGVPVQALWPGQYTGRKAA
jgi:lambda repressor-like predicted transcriptional regulator